MTDFTVEATPETRTISAGSSGTFTVQLAPRNGSFDAAVSLRATGLPRGCTASFSPSSVTPGSGAATSTLTVVDDGPQELGAGTLAGRGGLLPPGATLLLALAALFVLVRAFPRAPRRRLDAATGRGRPSGRGDARRRRLQRGRRGRRGPGHPRGNATRSRSRGPPGAWRSGTRFRSSSIDGLRGAA
ncbi:MAG: hypothetical protein MZW92_02220 [Comamonadaceae bacterium]|nr:hypothetical protein [Comamonadaceae bacterium]